jgi:hypothetical protein
LPIVGKPSSYNPGIEGFEDYSTVLQFNATIIVGVFLFLNFDKQNTDPFSQILILSTIFPFAISAVVALAYGNARAFHLERLTKIEFIGTAAKALAIAGTAYLVIILVYVFYVRIIYS